MSTPKSDATELWLRWQRAHEAVRVAVISDVIADAAVSEPELTVLVRLDGAGGLLRQNLLAERMGWDRTRLSHLLTRMEQRGYVERIRLRNGVDVRSQATGREIIDALRPRLDKAVRDEFLDRLSEADRAALPRILDTLLSDLD